MYYIFIRLGSGEKEKFIYHLMIRKIFFTILLLFFFKITYPQVVDPYNVDYYNFINYDNNVFHFYDTAYYYRLFKKYEDILLKGQGQLKILHLGGSHIQADIYSNRLRQRLTEFSYGNTGGRGFIFPYVLAETNNPWNYQVSYSGHWQSCRNVERNAARELGLSGITAWTTDTSASFQIKTRDYHAIHYDFNKIKIFHETNANSFSLHVIYPPENKQTNFTRSDGYTEIQFSNFYDSLHLKFTMTDTLQKEFVLYGISLENGDPGIIYNAVGVNGASLHSFLRCNLLEKHLKVLAPDWILISIGTNDANTRYFKPRVYRENYEQLITRIRKTIPGAAILLTVPNDSYLLKKTVNENTELVEKVIFELSEEYGCAVWDFYKIMGGFGSSDTWYDNGLMKNDRVHFTTAGYLLKGDLLFNAFLNAFEDYLNVWDTKK